MGKVREMASVSLFGDGRIRILDIGSSNLYSASAAEIVEFVRHFKPDTSELESFAERLAAGSAYVEGKGVLNESFVGELFEKCGMTYVSFDIASGYNTILLDLNKSGLPAGYAGMFDLVLNFGTTEHIFSQLNSFKVIHDATRIGGHVYHQLPVTGFTDHGYFTYTGRFFFDLAGFNHYEIVSCWFDNPVSMSSVFDPVASYKDYFRALVQTEAQQSTGPLSGVTIPNIGINVIYKKTSDAPFMGVLETSTSVGPVSAEITTSYVSPTARQDKVSKLRLGLANYFRRTASGLPMAAQDARPRGPAGPPPLSGEVPRLQRPTFPPSGGARDHSVGQKLVPDAFDALPLSEAHSREVVKELSFGVAASYGAQVEGDIAEFGTMTGMTALTLAKAIGHCDASLGYALEAARLPRKKLHLFDSFKGLPEATTDIDARSPHVRSGVWAPGTCIGLSKEQLFQRVAEILDPSRIRIFEGWFRDTLPTVPKETVYALVHIDSDLYESARDVLTYLFGHKMIAEGALLFFDNWNCNRGSPEFGERRAWSECVEKYGVGYSDESAYGLFSHRFLIHSYKQRR